MPRRGNQFSMTKRILAKRVTMCNPRRKKIFCERCLSVHAGVFKTVRRTATICYMSKDKIKEIHPLTGKQERFIAELLKGNSASDAYRTAYNAKGMKDSAIHTEASKLKSNPKIAQRLKQGFKRKEEYAQTSALSLRHLVLEQLQKEALNPSNNESSRIRALELIGKTSDVGLFVERIETTTKDRTPEEVATEIESKLEEILTLPLPHSE